ncbi:STAS domain-containing protein [Amycolatopsis balhimycina]|uniref:STAS domain-containing protein n=1 Tax=Amycolatopsis balhimycina TaxID=208443 RepID=UPI00037B1A9D|nr:STAS domain-containing protein [Amycolatopsis balhimycina]
MKSFVSDLPRPRRPLLKSVPPPLPGPGGEPASGGREPSAHRYQDLTITVERQGWALVVAVAGDVDLSTAPMLRDALDAALSQAPRRVVVDLSLVLFLNSAGLEVLLDAHRRAGPGIDLRLVATTRATRRPLQLARECERLTVHASRAAALAAPRRPVADAR